MSKKNKKVETIARAIVTYWDGRIPDWEAYGVPAWRKYETLALAIHNALEGKEAP